MDLATLLLPWLIDTFASWRMPLPDESALGVNAGITPGKSGISLFYAQGPHQGNVGMLYSIGAVAAGQSDIHLSATYNRQLTGWGLYVAGGLNLTYTIEESPYDEVDHTPWPDTLPSQGMAWNSRGISNPEFVFTIGEAFWFGHRGRFGVTADAGIALPFGADTRHTPYPVAGCGLAYRFNFN
jgi:hypothetical protein